MQHSPPSEMHMCERDRSYAKDFWKEMVKIVFCHWKVAVYCNFKVNDSRNYGSTHITFGPRSLLHLTSVIAACSA